jgi:hypothetical protein
LTSNDFVTLDINPFAECENLELFLVDDGVKLIIKQDLLEQRLPHGLEKLKKKGRLN